jgi:hypothetical protein
LKAITPGSKLLRASDESDKKILASTIDALWVALVRLPKDMPLPDKSTYVFPVNISAEVREVGKPSVLLQTFAKLFESQKSDLRDQARQALMPSVEAAAEQTAAAASADALNKYSTAVSTAYKAQADYRAACNDATKPTDVKKALARQHFLAAVAAQTAAESLATKLTDPSTAVMFNPRFATQLDKAQSDDVTVVCSLAST